MDYYRNFYEIKSNSEIFDQINSNKADIGYFKLPYENVEKIISYANQIKQENIIIIGIGGSALGTRAIYDFLFPIKNLSKKLFFLDTVDPLKISSIIDQARLVDSHFICISKSGRTVEPISVLKFIKTKVDLKKENTTIIAGKKTPLYDYAKLKNFCFFEIPEMVGGRFSVFSPVGLVPLAIVGIDIKELLNGCRVVHESFFANTYYYDHIINKARFLVENKARFNNNVIFSYSSIFESFNKWFVQLWAESLGKKNINGTRQGLTPLTLIGPGDQHSFLQLILEGPRNKTVTFFKVDNFGNDMIIPDDPEMRDFDLDYCNNLTFNDLINHQADSTFESILNEKDIPVDIITISKVDEYNIALLIYRYQLLVSCVGAFLQINPYDQPGVEAGKTILKKKLSSTND